MEAETNYYDNFSTTTTTVLLLLLLLMMMRLLHPTITFTIRICNLHDGGCAGAEMVTRLRLRDYVYVYCCH